MPGLQPAASNHSYQQYHLLQASGNITLDGKGNYAFQVLLEASREGNDLDGRTTTQFVLVREITLAIAERTGRL